jgi:Ser/Thr protein kinase RdoA (MazF antagonist)
LYLAAEAFFAAPYTCIFLGASSGFSGSAFARVEAKNGTWCLRRWPLGTAPATLSFIHAGLLHSRSRGFRGVPRVAATATGETVVHLDNIAFDAQEWVTGASLAPAIGEESPVPNPVCPLSPEHLVQLAAALADFHQSTSDLSPPPSARRPSLAERLTVMGHELERQQVTLEAWIRIEPSDALRELARAWLTLLPDAIARAIARSAPHATLPEAAGAVIHGDLWAPHVFFAGASFSGFVDFESLAWDAPAVDLAQLILHFNGWDERAAVLNVYGDHRALTATEHALLPAAAVLDLAGEGLWSLGILAAAAGRPPHRDRHVANLQALFHSLHALVST